jgi:hypothetical protein
MRLLRMLALTCVCVSAALIGLPLLVGTAMADPIGPGFDFFMTPPGGAAVDLGFGPIPLEGVPLPNFGLGLVDTVVSRMDPGPPEGGSGIIDIELVALHLKSVAPVDFDPGPAVLLGDLHITIDASERFFTGTSPHPDGTGAGPSRFDLPTVPNPPSIGKMEIAHGGPGPHTGAAMRACFGDGPSCDATGPGFGLGLGIGPPPPVGGIFASAFAVVPGGDPANSMDVMMAMPAPPVTLASSGTYLHTTLKPNYLGGVILGAILHVGPHPNTIPVPDAPVPEPSSVLLALCALIGYGLTACGRRSVA